MNLKWEWEIGIFVIFFLLGRHLEAFSENFWPSLVAELIKISSWSDFKDNYAF